MKNKEYWLNRAKIDDARMIKSSNKVIKLLKKELINIKREIKKELAYLYINKSDTNGFEEYRIDEVLKSIDRLLNDLYNNEEELLNKLLIDRYLDVYNYKAKSLSANFNFNSIDKRTVSEIIKTNWSGLTFSERIWKNKKKLELILKKELTKGLTRGDSIYDISRIISKKLNSTLSNAERLVRTEACWIQTKATKDAYKEYGLEEYEYSAFMDEKTSSVCQKLNGQIFKMKDINIGVNAPPMHPRCRSCILPVTK